jgi:polysaccharide biosynthesis/export protein
MISESFKKSGCHDTRARAEIPWTLLLSSFIILDCMACSAMGNLPSAPAQETTKQNSSSKDTFPSATSTVRRADGKLATILKERNLVLPSGDIPIGPGDVLDITVPGMDEMSAGNELSQQRVSGDGAIILPLIGAVHAAGLTQRELSQDLIAKFSFYMHNPPVKVFVAKYRSREVGVFGAVAKPGVYDIASARDTIQDMITLAGGMSVDAAQRIEFTPAGSAPTGDPVPGTATVQNDPNAYVLSSKADPSNVENIDLTDKASRNYLAMPVRPGDCIVVPPLGQISVEGWVKKPGQYPIRPRMDVLGAIAAAGGTTPVADTSEVRVLRANREKGEGQILVDLAELRRGGEDVPVEDGDVIEVSISAVKAVPVFSYTFITDVLQIGARGAYY